MTIKEPYARAGYKNKEKTSNEIRQLRKMLWSLKNKNCWCITGKTSSFTAGAHFEECIKIQNYFKANPFTS